MWDTHKTRPIVDDIFIQLAENMTNHPKIRPRVHLGLVQSPDLKSLSDAIFRLSVKFEFNHH